MTGSEKRPSRQESEKAVCVISHDTWECGNCEEWYEGGDEPPGVCAYCNEYSSWARLWKIACATCDARYHAEDKEDAFETALYCDHDVNWYDDDSSPSRQDSAGDSDE